MAKARKGLNFNNFLNLVKLFYFVPEEYLSQAFSSLRLKDILFFSGINLALGLLINSFTYLYNYQNLQVIFVSLTEAFLSIPIIIVFGLVVTLLLHIFAKILEGKGNFKASFKASALGTPILIFWWLPIIKPGLMIWLIYHLVVNFRFYHSYKTPKAMINILIPFFAALLALWALRIDWIVK